MIKEIVQVNGQDVTIYRINNSIYGNPRFLVHFLTIGLKTYESNSIVKKHGFRKYTGKKFGGGYVFSSYNIENTLKELINDLNKGEC